MKKLMIFLFLAVSANIFGQVERIEPPYWWAGMKQTELELLVYGDNISDLQPEFSGDITIKKVVKVENPNYLFVTVDTDGTPPGTQTLSFKKGRKIVDKSVGH